MIFKTIQAFNSKQVFDGVEDLFYGIQFQFGSPNNLNLTMSNFSSFYKIEKIIGTPEMYQLIRQIDGAYENDKFPKAFAGKSDLPLFFSIQKNNEKTSVIVVSAGESQPGRYKIFLEGIYETQDQL